MTVTLGHDVFAVDRVHLRAGAQLCDVRAETHGAALVDDAELRRHQIDHGIVRLGVELGRVGAAHAERVAGVLDGHHLQTEAQPETRDALLARVARRGDLAFDTALAEPAGDHDAVEIAQMVFGEQPGDRLGFDPVDLDAAVVEQRRMVE